MTEIEERAIYKRKLELKEEKRRESETIQKALKDYVDGKISYTDLPKRAQFFLSTNACNPPKPILTPFHTFEDEEEKPHKRWWQL